MADRRLSTEVSVLLLLLQWYRIVVCAGHDMLPLRKVTRLSRAALQAGTPR
jgi:hypothetical protein